MIDGPLISTVKLSSTAIDNNCQNLVLGLIQLGGEKNRLYIGDSDSELLVVDSCLDNY